MNYAAAGALMNSFQTTEALAQMIMPCAGRIKGVRVVQGTAPGNTRSRAWSFRKNASATGAITVSIANTATEAHDFDTELSFVAGDLISIATTPTNTPAASANSEWSANFWTQSQAIMVGSTGTFDATSARVFPMTCGATLITSTNQDMQWPTNGVLSTAYALVQTAPGGTETRTFTLYVNNVATSIVVTVTGAGTTGSDLTHSVSLTAGDRVAWVCTASAGVASTTGLALSMCFTPAIAGETVQSYSIPTASFSTTVTQFAALNGITGNPNNTEANRTYVVGTTVAKNLYVSQAVAPGTGKSYVYTLRDDAADTALTVTISDSALTGTDLTHSVAVDGGSLCCWKCVPNGTPADSITVNISFVLYSAPTPSTFKGGTWKAGALK